MINEINYSRLLNARRENDCLNNNKKTRFTPGSVIAFLGFLHVLRLIQLQKRLTSLVLHGLGAKSYQRYKERTTMHFVTKNM